MEGKDNSGEKQVIEFDYDKHTYLVDGVDFPSLSKILETVGLVDKRFYKPEHAERGQNIHELTALLDRDFITMDDVLPIYKGYCEAWLQFKIDCKAKFTSIEKPVAHGIYRYACTPDRIGEVNGKAGVVDIKSGGPERWHGVQLIAQALAVGLEYAGLYGVYLKEDGKYNLTEYKCHPYHNVFMSCLTLYQFKKGG